MTDQDLSPGAQQILQLRQANYPEDKIQAWIGKTAQQLRDANYPPEKIKNYFGIQDPDMSDVQRAVKQNFDSKKNEDGTPAYPRIDGKRIPEAKDVWDSLKAGFEGSVTGLFAHGMPDINAPSNPTIAQTLAGAIGQYAGDIPAMFAGGVGMAETGPIGAAAGAFAAPALMRKLLMDHYQKGDIKDGADFAKRAVDTAWETTKGAITGAATELTGGFGQALGGTVGRLSGELLATTTVSKALEGQLPDAKDFLNGAVAIGGLHAVGFGIKRLGGTVDPDYVQKKLMNIYEKTGAHPGEVVDAANTDPKLKTELLSENDNLPKEAEVKKPEEEQSPKPAQAEEAAATPKESPRDQADLDAEKHILGLIGEQEPVTKKGLVSNFMDMFTSTWRKNFDSSGTILELEKKLQEETGEKISPDESAYVTLRLHNARMDKVNQFISEGTRDFNTGAINGEGYKSIIDGIRDKLGDNGINTFNAYRIAKRVLNYESRGLKSPGDIEAHRLLVENHPEMQQFMDRYVGWRNRVIDYVGASGRYSQDAIQAMKDVAGDSFAPLKRIFEPDPVTGQLPSSSKDIKRAVGSERDLVDPFVSDMKDLNNMISSALETQTKNKFIDLFNYEGSPYLKKSEGQAQKGMTQIEGWNNGERTLYDTQPETAEVLNKMSGNNPAVDALTGSMKFFANLLRLGTVENPLFLIRHGWRQQFTGATLSQTGLKLFQAIMYAPEYLAGKSEAAKNFVYDGGAVNSIMPKLKGWIDDEIYKLDKSAPILTKAMNAVTSLRELGHWALTAHDNIIRFAEYKRMLDTGATRTESAFAAREVLPDFQTQGLKKSALDQMTAFLGVHLRGQERMFSAIGAEIGNIKDVINGDKDPIEGLKAFGTGYIVKNLAYITVPSLLLYAAQHNDDAINDLPDWQKMAYWPIHIDNWRPANSLAEAMSVKAAYPSNTRQLPDGSWQVNDGHIVRLQKPFTNGIFFGSAFEMAMESLNKKDPKAFEGFVKSIAGSLAAEPIPTAAVPALEHIVNKNFYTGQPIVRQSMESKLPETQYDRYTSDTAKVLGKLLSYVPLVKDIGPQDAKLSSPKVIDNYIHGWTGTLGYYAIDVLDKGIEAAGITPKAVKPTDTLADIPFVKEFMIRFPNARPQSVSDFEDRFRNSQEIFNSVRQLQKEGQFDEAAKLQSRYAGSMVKIGGVDKSIQRLNAVIQKVYQNPDIEPVQKRQLIDSAMYQMTSMAMRGNQVMDEYESMMKNKAGSN
jgi:hypothetical protein